MKIQNRSLSGLDLKRLLKVSKEAASSGSRCLMQGYRHGHSYRGGEAKLVPQLKGKNDLVTEFDLRSQREIFGVLSSTNIPIVAEEEGELLESGTPQNRETKAQNCCFYVDPLDGTTNFVHGHPFFAVSIGLLVDGVPRLGVVHAPALSTVWTAIYAGSLSASVLAHADSAKKEELGLSRVKRNGRFCSVSSETCFSQGLYATGFPTDRSLAPKNNFSRFEQVKKRVRGVRRGGSAAIDLAMVADGTYEAYWEANLNPWDLCAGAAMVLAASGQLSDYQGQPCDVRKGEIVASNGFVHQNLLEVLSHDA